MLYISSALSLYFPWDFCLYEGMTALAFHLFSYIPFIIVFIIVAIVLKYRYVLSFNVIYVSSDAPIRDFADYLISRYFNSLNNRYR